MAIEGPNMNAALHDINQDPSYTEMGNEMTYVLRDLTMNAASRLQTVNKIAELDNVSLEAKQEILGQIEQAYGITCSFNSTVNTMV